MSLTNLMERIKELAIDAEENLDAWSAEFTSHVDEWQITIDERAEHALVVAENYVQEAKPVVREFFQQLISHGATAATQMTEKADIWLEKADARGRISIVWADFLIEERLTQHREEV